MQRKISVLVRAAFDGPIPATLGKLGASGTGVVHINLKDNKFTGILPASIKELTALERFDVSNNKLQGELPPLHTLPKLEAKFVNLAGNDFACPVPSEDVVYDTAKCTCKAGYVGAEGATDGDAWDPAQCRDEQQKLIQVCVCARVYVCLRLCRRQYWCVGI